MCEILEQMRAESKEEGIEIGSINTCIKMSINFGFKEDAEILKKIAENFPNLPKEKAIAYLEEYKKNNKYF